MAHAHFPYVVVGGGPAGATAAERIAVTKQKVLLIEKSKYQPYREKPCGGGLGPVAIKLFPFVKMLKVHETDTLKLTMKGEDAISAKVPIVMVNRDRFDAHLVERAMRCGAKVQFERAVHEVDIDNKFVTLDNGITISYDHIIGAGGIACPVARAFGVKVKHATLIVGKVNGDKLNLSKEAEIRFVDGLNGYIWFFPKGKFIDVGAGGDDSTAALRDHLDNILSDRNLKLYDEVKWSLPYEPPWKTLIADETTILCGDAAGFVNPATGEGIRYAMQSGLEAAEVALKVRDISKYPSFAYLLGRLFKAREKIFEQDARTNFNNMKQNPDLVKETVNFFFEDKEPPERKPIPDTSKITAYRKMLEAIQEEE